VEQLLEHKLLEGTRMDGFAAGPDGDVGGNVQEYRLNDRVVLSINHEEYEFEGRFVTIEGSAAIIPKSDPN
jgi:hypothetical protein